MMLMSFIHSTLLLFLIGRSRYCIDNNCPNSVGKRRTHHREVIYKGYQLAIDLALTIEEST